MSSDFEVGDLRKRRRVSERRRVFSRIGLGLNQKLNNNNATDQQNRTSGSTTSTDKSSWSSSGNQQPSQQQQQPINHQNLEDSFRQQSSSSRSDSPLGDSQSQSQKTSMKIQFHITVAPENEPLILTSDLALAAAGLVPRKKSLTGSCSPPPISSSPALVPAANEQLHERLQRQNTMSTRRRQQLMAMHNKAEAMDSPANRIMDRQNSQKQQQQQVKSDLDLAAAGSQQPALAGREPGARSSTISGGMTDEATMRFLAPHKLQTQTPGNQQDNSQSNSRQDRELIYFKRDGQRFGHEFTLKLAVDRTYRCLLKVRPLIPLQSITIQGQHVMFADCSQAAALGAQQQQASGGSISGPYSAPASYSSVAAGGLNRSWQDIRGASPKQPPSPLQRPAAGDQHNPRGSRLNHAQTTSNLICAAAAASPTSGQKSQAAAQLRGGHFSRVQLLRQQQQSQMQRYFAASHCSSSVSNSHLGSSQLIYMFDWSASRFEVNKNKARTEVHAVLKFTNGRILTLPMQIKFYQSDCRQHLSWGSQLHFIDFDCQMDNSLGQGQVERVQYY